MKNTILVSVCAVLFAGCHSVGYTQKKADGTSIEFKARSLFSNSIVKGLTVDGTTKTTSQGLRITSTTTEPNPESITATGSALGELIGTAAKAAAKP